MPTLTFSFNTGEVPIAEIVDAVADRTGYQSTIADGSPNPETKQQYARRMVARQIIDWYQSYKYDQQMEAVKASGGAEITLT